MTDITVLVVLLIILAGIIAYTGDVLGTVIGKRRLSLFGARPKRSGRIIGVLAGILIMLVTLGSLALTFRNAVRVIMSAQPVGEQLAAQRTEGARLAAENERLAGENETLTAANAQLENQLLNQSSELTTLKAEIQGLQDQLANQADQLQSAQAQISAVSSGDLTYNANEVIHTGLITAQDPAEVQSQLVQLLASANQRTAQRRSGEVQISSEQVDRIVSEAVQTPGEDVVVLRSRINGYASQPVEVGIEVLENVRLVSQGQLVISRQIHLGSPELQAQRDNVRLNIRSLFTDANNHLLGLGLADQVPTELSDRSLEIDGFTNQLLRLSGLVTVGLAASDDIYTGEPAELEFVILN